jgi:hypothetical protein
VLDRWSRIGSRRKVHRPGNAGFALLSSEDAEAASLDLRPLMVGRITIRYGVRMPIGTSG